MAKYSKAAQKSVGSAMKRMEKGKLRSGKSNKKVTNPKQAIAIGLSEAREKGAKVPKKKSAAKKAVPVKKAVKKAAVKKSAPKKAVAKKRAVPVKKAAAVKKAVKKKSITKKEEKIKLPAEQPVMDTTLPPVEEKSPEIINEQPENPVMAIDKKALAKAVTKQDPKHPMQLSGPKRSIRPAGKKPLWR